MGDLNRIETSINEVENLYDGVSLYKQKESNLPLINTRLLLIIAKELFIIIKALKN